MASNTSCHRTFCISDLYRILKILLLILIAILTYCSYKNYTSKAHSLYDFSFKIPLIKSHISKSKKVIVDAYKKSELSHSEKPIKTKDTKGDNRILQNITLGLISSRLFTAVDDEPYIRRHIDYFKTKPSVNNGLNHSFVINGASVCKGKSPYLLILIPSVIQNVRHRNAIRQTWMGAAENNRWIKHKIYKNIRHVFFLGKLSKVSAQYMNIVRKESRRHQDIVLSDFMDSYKNLSRKMATALQWVDKYCPGVEYVLKCDQDTFVNVPLMLKLLEQVEEKSNDRNFVLGRTHFAQPTVDRKGKWAVSPRDYPLDKYPMYMYGHTYILTTKAIRSLVGVANKIQIIAPEDVFITGILPKVTGVTRLHAQSFAVCCRDIYDCEVVRNRYVSMTSVFRPKDHHRIWNSVSRGTCHPQLMFNYRLRRGSEPKRRNVTKV